MSESRRKMILIIGGARSGKSAYAEEWAWEHAGEDVAFIATAEALDEEMQTRIHKHRAKRPQEWITLEAPRNLPQAIATLPRAPRLIVIDCLTLWVTNELLAEPENVERRVLRQLGMVEEWTRVNDVSLALVTNEVGLGIVPDNALARQFRDVLGRVNARAARLSDEVYWMVAGLAIEAKQLARARGR